MLLLVGLGNIGAKYATNRHNIGFMAVEEIARRHSFPPWRARFQGQCSEGVLKGEKTVLLKPSTYMNESGRSVREAAQFYKTALDSLVVFHDELDLAPSRLRVKTGGGNAGHNGLRSITAHMGNDYVRVRLGIGHPGDKDRVHSYVLGDFAKSEAEWVDVLTRAIADQIELLASRQFALFQNNVHLALESAGLRSPAVAAAPS
jgi:PTH1 family peptidyl-tRNA hydrolase